MNAGAGGSGSGSGRLSSFDGGVDALDVEVVSLVERQGARFGESDAPGSAELDPFGLAAVAVGEVPRLRPRADAQRESACLLVEVGRRASFGRSPATRGRSSAVSASFRPSRMSGTNWLASG